MPCPAFPKNLYQFQSQFDTEEACQEYLFSCRWPEGFVCPRCGSRNTYELMKLRHWPAAAGTGCRHQVSLTAGTIFQNTRTPLAASTILNILRNPMYAGAYAFGKTESLTKVVDGRARKTDGHSKPIETWMVLLRDHHAGYISWEQFERNQAMLGENVHMKSRGGRSLLAGLLRYCRCGHMLHVAYSGTRSDVPSGCAPVRSRGSR